MAPCALGIKLVASACHCVGAQCTLLLSDFQSGQAVFWVSAQRCQRVIIEGSTDLRSWTPLRTNAIGLDSMVGFGFKDVDSSSLAARFYRVHQE